MWDLLKKTGEECRRIQDCLEAAAGKRSNTVTVEEWIEGLSQAERKHINGCSACREAARDFVAAKDLFRDVACLAAEARPWFAGRVMAAIAARERELANFASPWTEFPRFASRLAWITAVVLLAGTTWFYEKGVRAQTYQLNGAAAQESIFEAPPPANQDDVLISMAGNNP